MPAGAGGLRGLPLGAAPGAGMLGAVGPCANPFINTPRIGMNIENIGGTILALDRETQFVRLVPPFRKASVSVKASGALSLHACMGRALSSVA